MHKHRNGEFTGNDYRSVNNYASRGPESFSARIDSINNQSESLLGQYSGQGVVLDKVKDSFQQSKPELKTGNIDNWKLVEGGHRVSKF